MSIWYIENQIQPVFSTQWMSASVSASPVDSNTVWDENESIFLNWATEPEGSFVQLGTNVFTGSASSVLQPGGTIQVNGNISFDEESGFISITEPGLYKIEAVLNVRRLSGTGERSLYLFPILNGLPSDSSCSSNDLNAGDVVRLLCSQILDLPSGGVLSFGIQQYHAGGTNMGSFSVGNLTFNVHNMPQ